MATFLPWLLLLCLGAGAAPQDDPQTLNNTQGVSAEFADPANEFFMSGDLADFDPASGGGSLQWSPHRIVTSMAQNQKVPSFQKAPGGESPSFPFRITFVTPRTVRLRIATGNERRDDAESLMLAAPPPADRSWKKSAADSAIVYTSSAGSVAVRSRPWRIEFRDAQGRLLTSTHTFADNDSILQNVQPIPFSFLRRAGDRKRRVAAAFSLAPDEKIFGCGESFTELDKRGQKIVLCATDARGVQNNNMYKPVPFFLSSNGYGMFLHTSAPAVFDFGWLFRGASTLYSGDEAIDLFVFLGKPKEVLSEYTALTGRSPLPPLWSFGYWTSRGTYTSQEEVRGIAAKLRETKVPCDVVHIDTGWFETLWRCDFKFSTTRFANPQAFIDDLKKQGLRLSLWQLPYLNAQSTVYAEAVKKGYAVTDGKGKLPGEDAVIDFSNPAAVEWYQGMLEDLLKMGVGVIKADFGEDAPICGAYKSGKTGWFEHNLYPLRYNKAVFEVTKRTTGDNILWGRSAWAGCQRYPVHWGGDSECTDNAMAATLRAGLSFGLCGFSYWSHDIGGSLATNEELYRRWGTFGLLLSHSRSHGVAPKEPWLFSKAFLDDFRRAVEARYRLMPYIYAQAARCSEQGFPMMRTLFFEYPEDPACWLVDDEYLFGTDLLVAPLLRKGETKRNVYLPPGKWIDYQDGRAYDGARWYAIAAGALPVVLLARDGAVIPHAALAQSTAWIDWKNIELVGYSVEKADLEGLFCLPEDNVVRTIRLSRKGDALSLEDDPCQGKVSWNVRAAEVRRK